MYFILLSILVSYLLHASLFLFIGFLANQECGSVRIGSLKEIFVEFVMLYHQNKLNLRLKIYIMGLQLDTIRPSMTSYKSSEVIVLSSHS